MKRLVLILLFSGLSSRNLWAVNVQQYSRSNSLTFEMIEDARLENSHVYSDFDQIYTLGLSYVDQPLVVKSSDYGKQTDTIVRSMTNLHMGAAWYLKPWVQIGSIINLSRFNTAAEQTVTGFGDLDLRFKLRVYHSNRQAVAIMPYATVPMHGGSVDVIGDSNTLYGRDQLLSDREWGKGLKAIFEQQLRFLQLAFNIGYLSNEGAYFRDESGNRQLDLRQRLFTGIGFYFPILDTLGLNLEYQRAWTAPFFNDRLNPTELHLGVSAGLTSSLHLFSGVNFGNLLTKDDGNDFRAIVGLKFTPSFNEHKIQSIPLKPMAVVEVSKCDGSFLRGTNSATVLFALGQTKLNDHQEQALRQLTDRLKDNHAHLKKVTIYGHASAEKSRAFDDRKNSLLAKRRAETIKNFIISIYPPLEPLIEVSVRSDAEPLADADLGIAGDRRAELTVDLKEKESECQ